MNNKLEKLIKQLVMEAIQGFDMDAFKALGSSEKMIQMAKNTLPFLGEGTSRSVYKFDELHALKIALNDAGIEQNKAESVVCTVKPELFPKVISHDQGFKWILVDYAEPMSKEMFSAATGMDWRSFLMAMNFAFKETSTMKVIPPEHQAAFEKYKANPFFVSLLAVIKGCQYMPGDLMKIDSWGMIRNKPVIIDSGFTKAVQQNHYASMNATKKR